MYVADSDDDRVYSYNMPDAIDPRLAELHLAGVEIGEFDPRRTEYGGVSGKGISETTVVADSTQAGAKVVIHPPDADAAADGHQVALAGAEEITVTVISEDGSRSRVYRVSVGSSRLELALGPPWALQEWPGRSGVGVAEALTAAGLADGRLAIYHRDEASGEWLAFDPAGGRFSGAGRLVELERGLNYWVAAKAPLTWQVVVER